MKKFAVLSMAASLTVLAACSGPETDEVIDETTAVEEADADSSAAATADSPDAVAAEPAAGEDEGDASAQAEEAADSMATVETTADAAKVEDAAEKRKGLDIEGKVKKAAKKVANETIDSAME